MARMHSVAASLLLISSTAATAAETSKLYRSARFLGRGYAGISDPQDEDAIFYNPARLAHQEADAGDKDGLFKKVVFIAPLLTMSDTASDLLSAEGNDVKMLEAVRDLVGKSVHVGADNFSGVVGQNWALGLVATVRANILIYKSPQHSGLEAVDLDARQDMGLVGSYALSLLDQRLSLGATPKFLKRRAIKANTTIADVEEIKKLKDTSNRENDGQGFGLDLGATYQLKDVLGTQFGVTFNDLGDTSFAQSSKGPHVDAEPQRLNIGASIHPKLPGGQASVHFDIRDLLNREDASGYKRLHLGADYIFDRWVGLAIGSNQGFFTSGVFVTGKYARFDLGSYGEEIGDKVGKRPSRRYFMQIAGTM